MIYALLPWVLLMAAGLVASVLLIFWGVRSGQFADQERARFLPLRDDARHVSTEKRSTFLPEAYAILALMALTGVVLALTLVLAIVRR
jgi:cbb3-type cytochrome oxidase maturation protein